MLLDLLTGMLTVYRLNLSFLFSIKPYLPNTHTHARSHYCAVFSCKLQCCIGTLTQCLPLHSLVSHLQTQPLTMHTYNICIGIAMLQYCSRPGRSTLCHSWHSTHSLCCPSTLSRSEKNEGLKVSHLKRLYLHTMHACTYT